MTLFDLIIIGALVFFIVTRFTSGFDNDSKNKSKKGKGLKNSVEIKVVSGNAQTKDQIEKIFKKARELSDVENKRQVDKESTDALTRIKAYDESFTEKKFLKGAKAGFEWFYNFVSKDDDAALEKLTSPKIFAEMVNWLNELEEKNEKVSISVEFLEEPEILDCRTVAKTAFIDVKYNVNIKTLVLDKDSDDVHTEEEKDEKVIWTWAKNITSTDPNWQLDEISHVS